jgi:hypothetical protein
LSLKRRQSRRGSGSTTSAESSHVEYTGIPAEEWHAAFKSVLFPDDGRTSITQLSHDEMRDYMGACEQYAHERHPDAFALSERRPA